MSPVPLRRPSRETFAAYGLTAGLFVAALGLELAIARAGLGVNFLALSLAVAFTAWYAGFGPAVLTILLAALVGDAFILGPGTLFYREPLSHTYTLIGFAAGWCGVCVIVRSVRQQMARERESSAHAARTTAQAHRIVQLTTALGHARTPSTVIETALHEPMHALVADAGMLLLIGDDATSAAIVRAIAYQPSVLDEQVHVPLLFASPVRDAVHRRVPVILESAEVWTRDYPEVPADQRLTGYPATIAVPFIVGRRVAAVVRLDFVAARAFTSDDREYLTALAAHGAQALDRAWQYESAQRGRADAEMLRARADAELVERQKTEQALRASETGFRALATRTARMHDLTAALSEAVTVNAVARAVVQQGSALVGATTGSVLLLVDNGTRFAQLTGVDAAAESGSRGIAADAGLCATDAVATGHAVFVTSWAQSQERYWRSASLAADNAYMSSVSLPLLVEGAPIGVLEFHFSVPVNFDPDYRALLVSVALHCTQALDRARLYESAQRARAEAEAANRLKDDFLSIVSHELRTPLNAVVGWASMLRQRSLNPEVVTRAIQSIYDNAVRQTKLIDDLLDVSRMATGQTTLDREELDLSTLISGVVESVLPTAASSQIELKVRSMPAAVVMGDRRRLEQVFFNLIGNALKFTPSGGRITIEAVAFNGTVELRVSDTGSGIEPEFLPYVFDRFRQADNPQTRSYGGLGLGLSIAKQFVEAHGGHITVESAGPALGATFSVTLPLAGRKTERAVSTDRTRLLSDATAAPSLEGLTVLVVDDEPDAREVMAHALQAFGARVALASGSRDAFDVLVSTNIDVLLTDLAMPDEDGYSLIRRIRASADTRVATTPAAAVTAHAGQSDREQAFAAGFQRHLAKPVEPIDLGRAVDQLARGRAH